MEGGQFPRYLHQTRLDKTKQDQTRQDKTRRDETNKTAEGGAAHKSMHTLKTARELKATILHLWGPERHLVGTGKGKAGQD